MTEANESHHHEQRTPEKPAGAETLPSERRPRIWVGSLSDYNNGRLHGDWMDAAVEEADLYQRIQTMLAGSAFPPAEEWMIFDDENFGGYKVGEYADLDTVTRVARGIAEHGPVFGAFADIHDANPEVLDRFAELYLGAFESREAWAQTIVDDFEVEEAMEREPTIPNWLKSHVHIDLAGIAHDLQISGDVSIEDNPGGGIWVFDGRV